MEALKNLMQANMQTLSKERSLKEDEYIKNDLVYCKNCDTARQTITTLFGAERKVYCICKCQAEKRDKEEQIRLEQEKQRRINELTQASLLGDRYKNIKFENTETGHNKSFDEAFARCMKYCEVSKEALKKGYGIYLYGDKGNGKTHLTACIANELISQYKQVLFTNFFEISKSIRATFNGKGSETDLINKIANVDFLFIDDLGTERVTSNGEDLWLQEKIFDVINKRYNNMKPTIFTSNYSIPELITDRGLMDKTVDRIAEMSSAILKVTGNSYRLKKRSEDVPF